ncbi:iron(III) transport system substrate-binding protein [Halospina denitrificans]|uniref:Iron(III) transport system substrate-binding protein n=1 Tax=Halospina denitrificans TaxID=332522 RepID=A0A4V3EQQ9_9GAMM|nr:extracellular solute-binding protein [Halospina denitrificans]TDT42948.1 iron(III) transport system substrate-binding protein [Halospina denitrificans]
MERRELLRGLAALGLLGSWPMGALGAGDAGDAVSVDELPELEGELTLYLGRGEGGLYEDVIEAIRKRNPKLTLNIRRGPTVALANTLVAEAEASAQQADLFWAVDSGSLGLVSEAGLAKPVREEARSHLREGFRYEDWAPVSGRVRTLPYNPDRLEPKQIPESIMALPDTDLSVGWAPAYGSFQSFVTAMRLLEGDAATRDWLRGMKARTRQYAGELGVVMGVSRGEVDIGLANHYYTLRLKAGQPDAPLELAFTKDDAGSLLNASGVMALRDTDLAHNFIRYLLTQEVQSYLASEAYEIPMVEGVALPEGLPEAASANPPSIELTRLADVRPTLTLMRDAGVL